MNIRLAIQQDRTQIPVVSKTVRNLCALAEAGDHPAVKNIELAIVELLTNIIDYTSKEPDAEIELHCRLDSDILTVKVADSGRPLSSELAVAYSDGTINMPSIDQSVDSLPESGWGIQLIKAACDHVSYKRKNQRNNYKLAFDLSEAVT